jgi:hypothetical protein
MESTMDQKLSELIENKRKQTAATSPINWDDRRDRYIAAVNDLYAQIEAILADPIAKQTVRPHRRAKDITENYLGTYAVDDLILLIGNEQVRFSPRGRNVVGATGRVDVIGERNEATLILQPPARWGFVQSRQPTLTVVPFDEAALADVLQLVMRD